MEQNIVASGDFAHWAGPRNPKILLVGEAFGATEEETGQPFAGESGKELFRMLGEAMPDVEPALHAEAQRLHRYGTNWLGFRGPWLGAASVAMTNVFNLRPPGNKIEALCGKRAEMGPDYVMPPLALGRYVRPEHLHHLQRLRRELEQSQPNVVVALGNTACWALLRATNIGTIRGAIATSRGFVSQFKILPTYHPAGIMRNWSWRAIAVADLMKAKRESEFRAIRRPQRHVIVNPTEAEVERWISETLARPPQELGCDIETQAGQISCISFARSPTEALCVPFIDGRRPNWSYWTDQATELRVWLHIKRLLEAGLTIVGQNFLYDLQYIMKLGIQPRHCDEDTMLLHHSLFPELPKGLGFLGSIYSSEPAWKLMRKRKADTEKRDE